MAAGERWSQRVTETSNALDLEAGVFTWDDPRRIAESLLRSAECSRRRKSDPFRSAMSMLVFYINRAGKKLSTERRACLDAAKDELRARCGRPRRSPGDSKASWIQRFGLPSSHAVPFIPFDRDSFFMSELGNDCLLRALLREPVERTPVWMMRQAGRYLPEYRATREKAGSFLKLCTTPELACEVTIQPLERYPLDAAILFSDILTIPDAMGLGLSFQEGEGPRFAHPVRSRADIERLPIPDPENDLRYVMDTVRLVRKTLAGRAPLIGFAGSPWTLACYMVEGGGSRDFAKVKSMLYGEPAAMHALLDKLARAVALYLNAQIAAGAQAVMLFDTWGGVLTTEDYREFSLRYAAQVRAELTREGGGRRVPAVLFTKGGGLWLEAMAEAGFDALGLDWTCDIGRARARVGDKVALQGNLDPIALYAPPEVIRQRVQAILERFGPGSGHVFNLGHGILPDVPPEHAGAMIAAVHEFSPAMHQR
jgi:uroporphyrinogen decarboxylase